MRVHRKDELLERMNLGWPTEGQTHRRMEQNTRRKGRRGRGKARVEGGTRQYQHQQKPLPSTTAKNNNNTTMPYSNKQQTAKQQQEDNYKYHRTKTQKNRVFYFEQKAYNVGQPVRTCLELVLALGLALVLFVDTLVSDTDRDTHTDMMGTQRGKSTDVFGFHL